MEIEIILRDKKIKPKQKVDLISQNILSGEMTLNYLLDYAKSSGEVDRANCLEALEYVSKTNPKLINSDWFDFAVECLGGKAPRVKWEAARLIANIVMEMPEKAESAVHNLLNNTKFDGTVVKWSAATALGQIIKLKNSNLNEIIIPEAELILESDEKNSIKKIYLDAIKKSKK